MTKYSSKINKIRSFALSLIFIGFLVMYLGIFSRNFPVLSTTFMLLGLFSIISSTIVYFWIGMLSAKTLQVVCPSCKKPTKVLGRVDICMHCREPLTTERQMAGKGFDEKYNTEKEINR